MTTAERMRALLAGVRVTSPASFDWYHEQVELPTKVQADLGGAGTRRLLVALLDERLYMRFYLTGGRRLGPLPPPPRPWLSELPAELSRANTGVARMEPGWRTLEPDGGLLVVERDGLRIWARTDEVEDRGDGTARVRVPVDLPAISRVSTARAARPPSMRGREGSIASTGICAPPPPCR